jgi:hypothetical protein
MHSIFLLFSSGSCTSTHRWQTIWFGANDCNKDPGWNQHVPITRFKSNLISLINHPLVKAQSPHIILFTNPPVEETVMLDINKENGSTDMIRRAKDAKEYADAVKEVGKECDVPVLDVWTAFMKAAGWNGQGVLPGSEESGKNEVLAELLYDGESSPSAQFISLFGWAKRGETTMSDEARKEES